MTERELLDRLAELLSFGDDTFMPEVKRRVNEARELLRLWKEKQA